MSDDEIIRAFHELYYEHRKHGQVKWLDRRVDKCPMDLLAIQDIIVETRPDLIIECGTQWGGSALFMASICKLVGHGRVLTIDIHECETVPEHELITYIRGDTVHPSTVNAVKSFIKPGETVMVDLDSDHKKDHVLVEMEFYGPLVSSGCYMIVEDGNLNGNPVWTDYGAGPKEAIEEFLKTHIEFFIDDYRENKFLLTFFKNGFLKRK